MLIAEYLLYFSKASESVRENPPCEDQTFVSAMV